MFDIPSLSCSMQYPLENVLWENVLWGGLEIILDSKRKQKIIKECYAKFCLKLQQENEVESNKSGPQAMRGPPAFVSMGMVE